MGFQYKLCVTYSINANVAIRISDSQQKYVVLNAMRRSGGISKNLLMKKLKSKVYVSFQIRLYVATVHEWQKPSKCVKLFYKKSILNKYEYTWLELKKFCYR